MSVFTSLFGPAHAIPPDRVDGRPPEGLRLLPDFVTAREIEQITAWMETEVAWSDGSLQGNRRHTYVAPARPLPPWGCALGTRLVDARIFDEAPNYLHLFSYAAGQGLARHVDQECWGEVIAGLTLGSSRVLEFTKKGRLARTVRLLLMPGDLY